MYRSLLLIPGNRLEILDKPGSSQADAVVIDVQGDKANADVKKALSTVSKRGQHVFARINPLATGRTRLDLDSALVGPELTGICVDRVESSHDIYDYGSIIKELEEKMGLPIGHTRIIASLDTPRAVIRTFEICGASPRITGAAFNTDAFLASMGIRASDAVSKASNAASAVILAALASDVSVFDFTGGEGDSIARLDTEAKKAKQMGFSGKLTSRPDYVETLNRAFTPSTEEVKLAHKAIAAFVEGERKGQSAIYFDGELVDIAVVRRYRKLLTLADFISKRSTQQNP